MIKKLLRYYYTLKYLKPVQFWSRLVFPFKVRYANFRLSNWLNQNVSTVDLNLTKSIDAPESWKGEGTFLFLNRFYQFEPLAIDWNFMGEGKLWQYNLRYFEYLGQPDMDRNSGLRLIHQFIDSMEQKEIMLEPYPVSLRCINWIKFIVRYKIQDDKINKALYAQFNFLRNTLETHLLANHLLENLMALLYGAVYFQRDGWYNQTEKTLGQQLEEQILEDGAHYELSPMYHHILLYRILDCINLLSGTFRMQGLRPLLIRKAGKMLGWSEHISFKNGRIPYFNDSTDGIAFTFKELEEYARNLGLEKEKVTLGDSGYRTFEVEESELIVDAGGVGVNYQPGHAHCDMLSFELHQQNVPVAVNSGISTYEKGLRRELERSTSAHNSVSVGNLDQSDVWSSFRVGQRAQVDILSKSESSIEAQHGGFLRKGGGIHSRKLYFSGSNLFIEDKFSQKRKNMHAKAYFHFHPDVELLRKSANTYSANGRLWSFAACKGIEMELYEWASGFNKLIPSKRLVVTFKDFLTTKIEL